MFGSKIVVSSHPDMIATIAGTLGYMPHDSIVLYFYGGRRPGPVHRFDAPMPDQMAGFGNSSCSTANDWMPQASTSTSSATTWTGNRPAISVSM